jgi:hypothetical protein
MKSPITIVPSNVLLIVGFIFLAFVLSLGSTFDPAKRLTDNHAFAFAYLRLTTCPSLVCQALQRVTDTFFGTYLGTLEGASATLRGHGEQSDLIQDMVGFRALIARDNAYPFDPPELGKAEITGFASTHPPTAFLLVAPIAFLPWNWASAIWAWLMLGLVTWTYRLYGVPWKAAIGLTPLSLLWPPIAMSLGQLTVIWLFGLAWAYRFADQRPLSSGASVGLAAFTKLFPGLMILSFLLKKQWRALLGFGLVWIIAILILVSWYPAIILQYLSANRVTSAMVIQRPDNASLFVNSYRLWGWTGFIAIILLFFLIAWVNRTYFVAPLLTQSAKHWAIFSYFCVAWLPVVWIYSLTPLFPLIVWMILGRNLIKVTLGLCCLLIPMMVMPYDVSSALPLAIVTLFVGIGLLAKN